MNQVDKLTYLMDRYLEVANGYHHHNELRNPPTDGTAKLTGRRQRLLDLIGSLELEHPPGKPAVGPIDPDQASGQSVAATEEGFSDTERHQQMVRERMANFLQMAGTLPGDARRIMKVLELPPEQFLAHFDSVTFAWDTLVELGGLAVLPDAETIQAREIIFIQTADLEAHLHAMLEATLLADRSATPRVEVRLVESVEALHELEGKGELTPWLIRASISHDPGRMLAQICAYIEPHLPTVAEALRVESVERTAGLERKRDGFSDIFHDGCTIKRAIQTTDEIVSFGLRAGYAMWFVASAGNRESRATLRKNMLFSTRILLDEARWAVADDIATLAIDLTRLDNIEFKRNDVEAGIPMLYANRFWARRQLGKKIDGDVRAWDTSGVHVRYQFLRNVLLGEFKIAAQQARTLLEPEANTGFPNICMSEMEQWPILSEFNKAPEFQELRAELSYV